MVQYRTIFFLPNLFLLGLFVCKVVSPVDPNHSIIDLKLSTTSLCDYKSVLLYVAIIENLTISYSESFLCKYPFS